MNRLHTGTKHGLSWSKKREHMARTRPGKPVEPTCADCHVIGYDRAKDVFGPGTPEGYDTCADYAGYVKRCAAHDATPNPRAWVRNIPMYRLKRRMQQNPVCPYADLNRLLPKNHPEYRGR